MNFISVYLFCFLVFIVWLRYEQRKINKYEQKVSDEFWAREEQANRTRKKDISHLPLLHIDESEIPLTSVTTEEIEHNLKQIRQIIKKPMLDLSEYSNTDLKLAYGVANFNTLSEYDETYNLFLVSLTNLARSYRREKLWEAAEKTYRLALSYGSKKLCDYTELASVLLELDAPEQVSELIQQVEQSDYPRRESLAQALRETLSTYQ